MDNDDSSDHSKCIEHLLDMDMNNKSLDELVNELNDQQPRKASDEALLNAIGKLMAFVVVVTLIAVISA